MTAKRVYFFSGAEYVRFDHPLDGVLPVVYPRGIAGAWPGLTNEALAAPPQANSPGEPRIWAVAGLSITETPKPKPMPA